MQKRITVVLDLENVIKIKKTHCFECGKPLVKNGYNSRKPFLDKGLVKIEIRIHRKRYSYCGNWINIRKK